MTNLHESPVELDSNQTLAPNESRSADDPARRQVRFEADSAATKSMADELFDVVWDQLVFVQACLSEDADLETLLQKYSATTLQLMSMHDAMRAFFETVCRANLEVRLTGIENDEHVKKVVEHELGALVRALTPKEFPPETMLRAGLGKFSTAAVIAKMREALQERLRFLIREFFDVCERGLRNNSLGLIEWSGSSECTLVFYRRILCDFVFSKEVKEGETIAENQNVPHVIYSRTDKTIETEGHQLRRARYEHEVIKANRTPLDQSRVAIPEKFQPLVKAVPNWLRRHVEVVSGVQIRERIIEIEERTERSVQVREEYRLLSEPAIILGPIVFSGWGSMEIAEEMRRQEESAVLERAECDRQRVGYARNTRWLMAALAGIASTLAITAFLAFGIGVAWLALCFVVLGTALTWDAMRLDAQYQAKPLQFKKVAWGLASYLLLVGAFSVLCASFFHSAAWHGPVGIVLTLASASSLWRLSECWSE